MNTDSQAVPATEVGTSEVRERYFALTIALASAIALASVIFAMIGQILSRVEGSGQIYGPSVFTGWKPKFWVTDELMAAAGESNAAGKKTLWVEKADLVGPFVSWHLSLDLVFALLIGIGLRRLYIVLTFRAPTAQRVAFGAPQREQSQKLWLLLLPVIYVYLDVLETSATFAFFDCRGFLGAGCGFGISHWQAVTVQLLSDLKWLALALNVVVMVLLYLWPNASGAWSWRRTRLTRGTREAPIMAVGPPVGVVVLVVLLALLIAVPGGGPLAQMPDVVRAQIDLAGEEPQRVVWTVLAVLLLVATLLTVCLPSTKETRVKAIKGGSLLPLVIAFMLTAVLVAIHLTVEGRDAAAWAALGPLIVGLVLSGAAWVIARMYESLKKASMRESSLDTGKQLTEAYDQRARAQVAVSLVITGVVLVLCLGVVRAEVPLFMLTGPEEATDTWVMGVALVLTLFAPAAVAWCTLRSIRNRWSTFCFTSFGWKLWVATISLLNVCPVVTLCFIVSTADDVGTLATLMFSVSLYVLCIGGLGYLTRHWAWPQLGSGRLGPRTPWLAIVIAVWLVMSGLSGRGYHDARTLPLPTDDASSPVQSRTLDDAFTTWTKQFEHQRTGTCLDKQSTATNREVDRVPLVLVAAPGGGGKAAYWTAIGMDQVFSNSGFCAQSLFAASGVSGGSVGLTTALALPAATDAEPTADEITDEGPLAQTVAALMLRDLPRPFTTLNGSWRDRGAVLEDAWAAAAPRKTFTHDPAKDDGEKNLTQLGEGWWTPPDGDGSGPVLMLNGASVNDGCRVVIANVRGLGVGRGGCMANPVAATSVAPKGAVTGSIDVLDGLLPSERSEARGELSTYCDTRGSEPVEVRTLRATTAALLSARFPYLTPSGALDTCRTLDPEKNLNAGSAGDQLGTTTTYVVDGGYLENTGILTLLQTWHVLKPRVLACNAAAAAHRVRQRCPRDEGGEPLLIEPWVVMLENHYRSRVSPPPSADRPKELAVPLATSGKRDTTLATTPMEQAIAFDMSAAYGKGLPACNRFVRLAPLIESQRGEQEVFASIEAPLGWVLATDTKVGMQNSLEDSWNFNVTLGSDEDYTSIRERCP